MATIGLAFFLEGFGQLVWGSDVYKLDSASRRTSFILEGVFPGGMLIDPIDLVAAVIAGVLVAVLAVFFQTTRIGRALRAVADDHEAAQSVGIPLNTIWLIVWSVAAWWRWSPA